jgi:hypothetical protein
MTVSEKIRYYSIFETGGESSYRNYAVNYICTLFCIVRCDVTQTNLSKRCKFYKSRLIRQENCSWNQARLEPACMSNCCNTYCCTIHAIMSIALMSHPFRNIELTYGHCLMLARDLQPLTQSPSNEASLTQHTK